MRLIPLLALLATAAPARAEPCPIGSVSKDGGGGLPDKALPRDSERCRRLEKAWPDFVKLVRAAGLDPKRRGLFFAADDEGSANAAFTPATGNVMVNGDLLDFPGYDDDFIRGILAHEIGHAVQRARGIDFRPAGGSVGRKEQLAALRRKAAYEGQADAIGAQLMETAGFGGAEAMRRMWKTFFGCGEIRASAGSFSIDHPSPGVRYTGTLAVEDALQARKRASKETRRVLEGDPSGDAMRALFGGKERPIRPIVSLEDMTDDGAPQPGATAMRDLSMPGAAENSGGFAEHALAADRYADPATGKEAAAALCPPIGPPAP